MSERDRPMGLTDPMFGDPYVDLDEWREEPVRHRYVHGGFAGTDCRFSMYFPEAKRYQGRFFHPVMPVPGTEHGVTSGLYVGYIEFSVASGAMLDTGAPGPGRGKRVQRLAGRARARASELVEAAPADSTSPLARVQRSTTIAARAARVAAKSAVARTERRWVLTTAGLLPRPGYHQYDVFLRLSAHMARGTRGRR